MAFLRSLTYAGIDSGKSASEQRSILLCNLVSLGLFILGTVLFIAYYYWYGWWFLTGMIEVISVLSLMPLLLNKFQVTTFSRFWICLLVPAAALWLSIYGKILAYDNQQELDYFTFRFIILGTCVFPPIFFSFREKNYLIPTALLGFAMLMLYDPLHTFFGVPYQRDVLKIYNYYFTNIVILITYFILMGAILFLRYVSEKAESRADKLIKDLNEKNKELEENHTEIEAQNHEIKAQSENLNTSQRKLQDAYTLIEDQKELLVKLNKQLSSELMEINKDLTATNTELIKHNNELRQFSYTVSHNLRGPVASLSGLINLIDGENFNTESAHIYGHIRTSIQKLETVIRDLSQIIDIRHDIFHIRKKIDLAQEVEDIIQSLKRDAETFGVSFKIDMHECFEMYSVKPMIHSILYNLISNAMKYRSTERRPEISIRTQQSDDAVFIEVQDNGLGIDLKNHKHNLFKLYKRFHYHTEGKGLGLYLVKLQTETLGGSIDVDSEINRYTRFTVTIPKPENIQQQILYKSAYATIFYDATLNATGVIWDGPISSDQYRSVFTKCLEFVKAYSTPNYIADLSRQGHIMREDQQWMFQYILPDAARFGLKRIAAIRPDRDDPLLKEYFSGINEHVSRLGIEQNFFSTFEAATDWLQSKNEVPAI